MIRFDTTGRRSAEPTRMCIACRTRRPQSTLCRLSRRSDGVVVPSSHPRVGRGAYLCPSRRCFDLACKRRAFTHALRTSRGLAVQTDPATLWPSLLGRVDDELRELGARSSWRAVQRAHALRDLRGRLHERGENV